FSVFNRWGEVVFTTSDASKGWDGKVNGVVQAAGVYVWMITAWSPCTGDIFEKGTVLLVR
ncbi:MAG: gliding motility-associated C-terminal domain-containing protein, partial [Cytophagaceae bacterium]